MARPKRGITFMDRVHEHTKYMGECIVFEGCKDDCGYGRINKDGRLVRVHRAIYEMNHGPIPDGLVVMHSCDNRACYNLAHLSLGTQVDNIKDMDRKGRRRSLVGSKQSQAKLNEDKVRRIRKMLADGATGASLAREYGVTEVTIYQIKSGRNWSHVSA